MPRAIKVIYGNVSFASVSDTIRGNFGGTEPSFQVWNKFRTTASGAAWCGEAAHCRARAVGTYHPLPRRGWQALRRFFMRPRACERLGVQGWKTKRFCLCPMRLGQNFHLLTTPHTISSRLRQDWGGGLSFHRARSPAVDSWLSVFHW